MRTTTSSPASAAADNAGSRKVEPRIPTDLVDLPSAPRGGPRRELETSRSANIDCYRRALANGEVECWQEMMAVIDGEWRRCRLLYHVLQLEQRFGEAGWDQAHIADDGRARVRRHGEWHEWSPQTLERRPAGHAPRTAASGRARGGRRSALRASSRSGDSGDGEPGEPEPRRCPCGCGEPLTGKQVYASDACRKRVARDNPHYRWSACSEAQRQAIWRRLGGGELLLAAAVGFIDPRELVVLNASGEVCERQVREAVAAA